MSVHPITARIKDAVAHLERLGVRVTPDTVKQHVRRRITYADLTTEEMLDASIDRKLRPTLSALGYVITDQDTLNRRLFDECTPDEFESQVEIQAVNVQRCRDRLDADRRVLAFLRAKEGELGRPVTAGEFAEEIAALIGEPQEQAA